jgi:hypothetical protein
MLLIMNRIMNWLTNSMDTVHRVNFDDYRLLVDFTTMINHNRN